VLRNLHVVIVATAQNCRDAADALNEEGLACCHGFYSGFGSA
jgi:predicted choloylglycine hydrolase